MDWFKFEKGHNKVVYCYFASLAYMQSQSESRSLLSDSLQPHGLYLTRLLCPWNFPGKNTGMGSHFPLWGIFPTQGSNPGLLHCRQILYCLSHQGSPRILKWVAYPFFRGYFWPRDLFLQDCLAIWGLLLFHVNFRIICSSSVKKCHG